MSVSRRVSDSGRNAILFITSGYVLFSLLYLAVTVAPLSRDVKYVILDSMYLLPALLAMLASAVALFSGWLKRKSFEPVKFFLYLFCATLLLFAGELVWTYYEIFKKVETPPFPSLADYFFLSSYIFFFAMVFSFIRHSDFAIFYRAKNVFQIFAIIIFSYVLFWIYVLKPLSGNVEVSIKEALITFLYSAVDVGIIFGISINLILTHGKGWKRWEILVATGLLTYSIGNFLFNFLFLSGSYEVNNIYASICDLFWMTGYFLYFLSPVFYFLGSMDNEVKEHLAGIALPSVRLADILLPVVVVISIPYFTYLSQFYATENIDYYILLISVVALTILAALKTILTLLENKKLSSLISTDLLTGLHNHRFFHESLEVEIERAKRSKKPLSIAIIDIDYFDEINNIYGHQAGDKALSGIASRIKSACRSYDFVCRIGGDEFGIIFPEAGSSDAYQVCQRIKENLEKIDLFATHKISASMGIAEYKKHAQDKNDLIKKADEALYWAKYRGKGEVVIYDKETVKFLDIKDRLRIDEKRSYLNTVRALAAAVDARDKYTLHHSRNVAAIASLLAKKINFNREEIGKIEIAGLLHDVGKVGIPDNILKKADILTSDERKVVEEHPVFGEKILKTTDLKEILPWIRHHHERWDGKGYPDGLKGEMIPIEARILSIADAFDAMISERPYRAAYSFEEAVEELKKQKGKQFDPHLVDAFVDLISEEDLRVKLKKRSIGKVASRY